MKPKIQKLKKWSKTKKTITLWCCLILKNETFPRFPSFQFCSTPKIENSEISESFFFVHFLVVYETQDPKTKEKRPKTKKIKPLRYYLIRKNKDIQGFRVFSFGLYPKSKKQKSLKVFFTSISKPKIQIQKQRPETKKIITLLCGLIRRKWKFPMYLVFHLALSTKYKKMEISESFRLL